MNSEGIAEVGVDEQGRIYIRPVGIEFGQIYRAAMEVQWDEERGRLYSPVPRKWSLAQWYTQIVAAAADEYGVALERNSETKWNDVPPEVRLQIEALPES